MDLLAGSDSEEESKLTINKDYASRYDRWRKNEELQKLKDKYGNVEDLESSSTSEEEDDEAVELTEDVEKDFFKTLACLKDKNPIIYDNNVRFFKEKKDHTEPKKPKEKSLSIAAYQRKILLETDGKIEDNETKFEDRPQADQERLIKDSFKDVLKDSDDENDDKWGGLFEKKVKTKEQSEKEEADYKKWLAGQELNIERETKKELKGLRDYWNDPNLDEGEKFLRDYILNKSYLDKEDRNYLSSESEEEDLEEKQEEFERKYNFRFQEPDAEFIKRYPRTVEQSMRKKDDSRKKHREELKKRKAEEKLKKEEELNRLKALKRAEILEKIAKLQATTGNQDFGFNEKDIEGDFDPNEHDKRMSTLFNDEYYGHTVDAEKPVFDDDDEELKIENWDNWTGPQAEKQNEELHCEDPGFIMDCDYDPTKQEILKSTKRGKRRRQSVFAQALANVKPTFDPKMGSFEKYIDEYYSLDYEDLIGDIPCRFKYRKVVPNDYGLDIAEILSAPDKELNRWASVKKIMKRRPEHVELNEVKIYKKKAMDLKNKKMCIPSLFEDETAKEEKEVNDDKNNQKADATEGASKVKAENKIIKKKRKNVEKDEYPTKIEKKFKNEEKTKTKNCSNNLLLEMSSTRLKSYGVNPKKFKNKVKYNRK